MNDRFVAIDFETANADLASICQVGVVTFENGVVLEEWGTLVNPQDYFHWMNVSIHGLDEDRVKDAPTFPQIVDHLASRIVDQVVVTHTSFDRAALSQALAKHKLKPISCTWLDSARVVRRTWEQFSRNGYGLGNVCSMLGISFKAHDAVEDARAAGEVVIHASIHSGVGLHGLLSRVSKPVDLNSTTSITYDGSPDGALFGEEVVFTGALTIPRRDAATMAAKAGCNVADNVTKSTTLLVVGDQDITKLAGHEKSAKHRKAEKLVEKGRSIRILRETDFVRLIGN